mmetsp:Transcript_27412/g.59907  ORF Transcript_27412/g.59907 Transcript_27412/m.59907 type:complete len:252 (+) Transcript_27412:2085-2840(+)
MLQHCLRQVLAGAYLRYLRNSSKEVLRHRPIGDSLRQAARSLAFGGLHPDPRAQASCRDCNSLAADEVLDLSEERPVAGPGALLQQGFEHHGMLEVTLLHLLKQKAEGAVLHGHFRQLLEKLRRRRGRRPGLHRRHQNPHMLHSSRNVSSSKCAFQSDDHDTRLRISRNLELLEEGIEVTLQTVAVVALEEERTQSLPSLAICGVSAGHLVHCLEQVGPYLFEAECLEQVCQEVCHVLGFHGAELWCKFLQ